MILFQFSLFLPFEVHSASAVMDKLFKEGAKGKEKKL